MPHEKDGARTLFALAKRWPAATAWALLFPACAPHTSVETVYTRPPSSSRQIPVPKTEAHHLTVPLALIDRVILEADLKCESQEACPANVAMLIIKDKTGLSQCTGFLIGPQTLMTNSHCLPKELRTPGAACETLTAVFPPGLAGGNSSERIACATVQFASAIAADEGSRLALDLERRNQPLMDFALLNLKTPAGRAPLEINSKGLHASEALAAWTVDPTSEVTPGGVLRKKTCRPAPGSVLAPEFKDKEKGRSARVAAFSGCDILHGNSGSPLVDSDGKARGVIFATLPARQTEEQKFSAMSLATNLACVDLQAPGSNKCPSRQPRQNKPQLDEATAGQIKAIMQEWAHGEGAVLSRTGALALTAIDDGAADLVWSQPRCLNKRLAARVDVNQAPIWRVHFSVDEVYRPQVAILARGQLSLSLIPSAESPGSEGQRLNIERKARFKVPPERPKALEELKTIQLPICRSQSGTANDSLD